MNTISLTGRLQADPDLHLDREGRRIATMRVVVTDHRCEHDVVIDVITRDSRAAIVARHLTAGRLVGIEGRLIQVGGANQHRRWTKHQVLATTVDFLDANPRATVAGRGPDDQR